MFFLAIRYLTSKKKQTVLTLLGIVLGTAAYVAISGLMLGFQTYIVNQLINNDAQIRISAREEPIEPHSLDRDFFGEATVVRWHSPPSGRRDNSFIEYAQGWFDRLSIDPQVLAYSPQLSLQGIAQRAKISVGARLIGSEPSRQIRVTNIEDYMTEGKFKDVGETGNRIVVGDGLLGKLGARVSETLLLSAGKGLVAPFKVVGAFHLGIKSLDDTTIFGALHDFQKLNHSPSQISDIAVRLTDVSQAGDLAASWAILSADKVQSWDQANEGTLSVFKTQDIVRNSMTVSILVVAGFGIYNILNMAVSHKRREIAILRSIGYEPGDILFLFFVQGILLGILGGLIGVIIGYGASAYMSTIRVSSARMLGGGTMMVSFEPLIYVKAFFIAFLAATVASILPARAAGKLTPIEIIRSEGG